MSPLDSTLSVLFVGHTVAAGLWAISCMQAWQYFCSRPKDSTGIKVLIIVALAGDAAHQVLVSYSLYQYSVTNFGNVLFLRSLPRVAATIQSVLAESVAMLVHGFYVLKIWKLSRRRWLVIAPIIAMDAIQIGFFIGDVIGVARSDTWEGLISATQSYMNEVFMLAAVNDVIVAVAIALLLRGERTGYQSTNLTINRILMFVVSTNMLTSACACATAILRLASPKDILWMACYNILIRLYTNSFLAALNMRPYFRGDNSHSAPETLMLSPCRPGNSGNHLSVHVDQSVETKVDDSFGAQAISV